jgi:hypothetical protein
VHRASGGRGGGGGGQQGWAAGGGDCCARAARRARLAPVSALAPWVTSGRLRAGSTPWPRGGGGGGGHLYSCSEGSVRHVPLHATQPRALPCPAPQAPSAGRARAPPSRSCWRCTWAAPRSRRPPCCTWPRRYADPSTRAARLRRSPAQRSAVPARMRWRLRCSLANPEPRRAAPGPTQPATRPCRRCRRCLPRPARAPSWRPAAALPRSAAPRCPAGSSPAWSWPWRSGRRWPRARPRAGRTWASRRWGRGR